ncbi:MAG: MarR family transcriptional regulator [Candidatus Heimdallarchaeota archaeon]|nr:MarR family transcriptional regulator [Candidatus Heimdallarchaeota archaeon]
MGGKAMSLEPTCKERNSAEDYLRAIRNIEGATGKAAGTNELAKTLQIAPATVTEMVQKLEKQGYVSYRKYYGVRLTTLGQKAALISQNKHRLLKSYLKKFLNFTEEMAEEEADILVHCVSLRLSERLCSMLDRPDWLSCKDLCSRVGPEAACDPKNLVKDY